MTPAPEVGNNVFKCSVPNKDSTPNIVFNAFVDPGSPADPQLSAIAHQTNNINLEGYTKGDSGLYDTLDNFYDMIYVLSLNNSYVSEVSGAKVFEGEWFSINPSDSNYYKNNKDYYGSYGFNDSDTSTDTDTDSDKAPNTDPTDFDYDNIEKYIYAYHGSDTVITIPSEINGTKIIEIRGGESKSVNDHTPNITKIFISDGITTIGSSAFAKYTGLKSIIIPDSVTSIENNAFYNCGALTYVTLPDSITKIGTSAFSHCTNLTNIEISASVTSIEMSAFYGCEGLISVTIPDGIKSIEKNTFKGCTSLTSVTIPASVTKIEYRAFDKCRNLTDVYYSGTIAQWKKIEINYDNPDLTDNEHLTVHAADGDFIPKLQSSDSDTDSVTDSGTDSGTDSEPIILGDINNDDKVTAKDSLQIQRHVINLVAFTDNQKKAADADGNGKVTNADALIILRYTIHIKVKYPIGEQIQDTIG